MKISIGCDPGGYQQKQAVIKYLLDAGYEVEDVGTYNEESCHYPIYGEAAARKVASGECQFGIVICTSGEGIMISANKVPGVRCGLASNDDVARLMRQHNDANMIAFGAKFMSDEEVINRIKIFLETKFEGGRHALRVDLINKIK